MTILYIFNISFFIWVTTYKIIYLSKYFKFSFFNPISIPFLISIPVTIMTIFGGPTAMLDDGLFDDWYNFALLMTNINLLISLLLIKMTLYFADRNRFIKNKLINITKPEILKRKRVIYFVIFFMFLFLISFFLLSKNYGFVNWILNPRTGYQLHRFGVGHWYALCLLFLSTSFSLLLLYSKSIKITIFYYFFYMFLLYFLASKMFMMTFTTFYVIYLWYMKIKNFNLYMLLISFAGFSAMLINFGSSDIVSISHYFDYFTNAAMYYESYFNNGIELFYGEVWLSDFYQYIPRGIFPDKPYVYGIFHVNEYFFPGLTEQSFLPAFSGMVFHFADFGIVGVLFFSIFNLQLILSTLLLYLLYKHNKTLDGIKLNSNKVYLFLWLLAPSFMGYFMSIYTIILMFFIIKLISFFNRAKI